LWRPGLYDGIKVEAERCSESVNSYVHSTLKILMMEEGARWKTIVEAETEYVREPRTRRVYLLWRESLYESIKAEADKRLMSVNDYVHLLMEGAMQCGDLKLLMRQLIKLKNEL